MNLTGLDIETTGTDYNAGHRLIQIGIVLPNGTKFKEDVQPEGTMSIDAEAMSVNGFTLQRIARAKTSFDVDIYLSQQLYVLGYTPGSLTPVGWNVGGFDLGFIKKELPHTAKYFSYRVIDLTGIALLYELRTGKSGRELKDRLAKETAIILGRNERHDALYDAEAALVALRLMREMEWESMPEEMEIDPPPDLVSRIQASARRKNDQITINIQMPEIK